MAFDPKRANPDFFADNIKRVIQHELTHLFNVPDYDTATGEPPYSYYSIIRDGIFFDATLEDIFDRGIFF